jgi:hypothetical protein
VIGGQIGEQASKLGWDAEFMRDTVRGSTRDKALNLPEAVTYVYRAGGPHPRALVNQALDDAGFATARIHAAASGDLTAAQRQDAATSPLTRALVATVARDPAWSARLTGLLA